MTLLITSIYMFMLIYFCLPEVDLEEDQSCPRPYILPTSEILGFLLTYALIPILSVIFALAHETICILYHMVGSTHHTPKQWSVIYIPLVSPMLLILWLCAMQMSWLVSFCSLREK